MARTVAVDLIEPIATHHGPAARVVLREPNGRQYADLGDPSVYARNPDGTAYVVENPAVIAQYLEGCIVEPEPLLTLPQLGLADAMRVKDALLDFFAAARQAGSKAAPSSSSGNAA